MLNKIYPFLLQRNKKYLYEWNKAIIDSKSVLNYNMKRYEELDFNLNEITKRLKSCVFAIDLKTINQFSSVIEIYLSYIEPMRFKIEAFWNSVFPITNKGPWLNNFNTCEVLIPVQSVDPLDNLPQDFSWENSWENIKPININYFDSIELSYNIINKLNFTLFQPSVFIFTVDINKFILKYLSYTKFVKDKEDLEKYVDNYVYKYLYLPLINDILNIWIFNIVDNCMRCEEGLEEDILINSQNIKLTPPSVSKGIKFLLNYKKEMYNKNTIFEDFMATDFFDGKNLPTMITTYFNNYRTYDLMQYRHLQFLLELPYLRLIYSVLKNNRDVKKKPIDIYFERGVLNYYNDKISNRFKNEDLKNFVENSLSQFLT